MDKVLSLHYLSGTGAVCLIFEGGDVVTVEEDPLRGSAAQIEIRGTIDAGIMAASWSPDDELLVIATKTDTVIFMGSTFDPVAEVVV